MAGTIHPSLASPESTSRRARRSERQLARDLGGRRQLASGSKPHHRGDIVLDGFLGETKLCNVGSYRLTAGVFRKIEREALAVGKRPFVHVRFTPEAGSLASEEIVVFPLWAVRDLLRGK